MYKLILVDDESDVREGILQEIEWEKFGFEISGVAENGREAFDLIEKIVPDLIITDIKMPFMDGLKLSELVRQSFPATKIIILTGFDEFEFAQKAIKLHIDEYVLKPFSAQELINALIKVKNQIDEEMAQKNNINILKEHYVKSLPVLKENFLTLLITKKLQRDEILDKSRSYNIDISGNGFVASVISMDHTAESFDGLEPSDNKGLSLFAILNITEDIIRKYQLGTVFIHDNNLVVLSVCSESERDIVIEKTFIVLEEIRYSIEKYLKFSVTIGIGTVTNDITNISYSYEDAVMALDYRLILGTNRIICINDLEMRHTRLIVFDELKEKSLACCLKVGTYNEVSSVVDSLFGELTELNISYKDYQIYLMEMLTSVLKIAKDANIDLDYIFGLNFNLFTEINSFSSIAAAKNWTIDICTKIMGSIATQRQTSCRHLVNSAREYMQNHYHECDMAIDKICRYLHISPGYFSSIFKKETKITILNYLVQLRMEAAKELLRTTELKTFEIAEKVGFSEANYFSNSFKKNFGISPSEYRKQTNLLSSGEKL